MQIINVVRPMLLDCRKQSILTMMAAARAQSNVLVAVTRLELLDELGISGRERRLVGLQNDIKIQESMVDDRKKAYMLARMLANIIKDEVRLYVLCLDRLVSNMIYHKARIATIGRSLS